jgi:Tfp pilus assembly protein PilF
MVDVARGSQRRSHLVVQKRVWMAQLLALAGLTAAAGLVGDSTGVAARSGAGGGQYAQLAQPPASPAPTSTVEELSYRGQRFKAQLDPATATLVVELNGRVVASVASVGALQKPVVLTGTQLSLFAIWTRNAAQNCSRHVLIAFPTNSTGTGADIGAIDVKSGFGPCNAQSRQLQLKRAGWEFWSMLNYTDTGTQVSVAVARNDRLAISEHPVKPCLFSKIEAERTSCGEAYIAAALGSVERGVPSGEARAGGHWLQAYQNRLTNTGSLELNGRPYQTFANVATFNPEPAVVLEGSTLFSVWLVPTNEPCGYRTFLRLPGGVAGGGSPGTVASQTLDRVGVCRPKNITHGRRSADGRWQTWSKIMWRDGDQRVDVISWVDGSIKVKSVLADPCMFATPVPSGCIEKVIATDATLDTGGANAARPIPPPVPNVTPAPTMSPPVPEASINFNGLGNIKVGVQVQKGFKLLLESRIDLALAEFDKALIVNTNDEWAYVGRGYGLAIKGRLDNALTDLDRAVQLNPRSAHAYCYRGFVFWLRGEPERALAQFNHALSLNAKLVEAYTMRATTYLSMKDTDKALADINQSLTMLSPHPAAQGIRGGIYFVRKEYLKAIDDYTAAIAGIPKSLSMYMARAQVYEALKRTNEAMADYKIAAHLPPVGAREVLLQIFARQRVLAGVTTGKSNSNCPKGETCL